MNTRRLHLLLFLTISTPAFLLGNGIIKGRVIDKATGQPLLAANVVVIGTSLGSATSPEGDFIISRIPPGAYSVRASYIGYSAMTVENVRVYFGLTTEVSFPLESKAVSVEEVVVVAQRPLINKSSTNALRVMTDEDVLATPVRGIDNIMNLIPGVVVQDGNTHIRGGRSDETGFYLDGVSITNPQSGGRAITVVQDALEEISVQSGGYDAEFGRANAGIVQHSLKSGRPEFGASLEYITDNIALSGKDQAYSGSQRLGAYWYGYNELSATATGPIPALPMRFFGLFNYYTIRDRNPQPYPGFSFGRVGDPITGDTLDLNYPAGILYKNSDERYIGTGTVNLDLNPLVLRFSGSYAYTKSFYATDPSQMYNLDRVTERIIRDGFASLKATYFFSPTTFAEISGGYFSNNYKEYDPVLKENYMAYGDSVANAEAGYVWERRSNEGQGRYLVPRFISVYGSSFWAPGDIMSTYAKQQWDNVNLSAAFSATLGKNHTLKVGGDYLRYDLRAYRVGWAANLAGQFAANDTLAAGNPNKLSSEQIMIGNGVNNYGFDVFGNPSSGEGPFGPRHPVYASAYIQDRMEFNDIVLRVGLRYDYINTNTYVPIDPTRPELTFSFYDYTFVNEAGLRKSTPLHYLSPRLGAAFAVTDRTVFHVQYGKLIQQAQLSNEIWGIYGMRSMLKWGASDPLGFDLRPMRTTQYEIGFTQQIGDMASFDITGYYKDIQDQIVIRTQETASGSQWFPHQVYANGDFATTKGIEISFSMRRYKRLQVGASVAFQDAQGSGSFPNSNAGIVLAGRNKTYTPQYVSPLSFNNAIRGNVNLDFRFGRGDGGSILQDLGATLLVVFNSGHPYTRATKESWNLTVNQRTPAEPLNTSTTPWFLQIDARIDKTFRIGDRFSITAYIFAINLLDRKNVLNVWPVTGSDEDFGRLTDPDWERLTQVYGQLYEDLSRALVSYSRPPTSFNDPYFWAPPRQIRLGLRLEY